MYSRLGRQINQLHTYVHVHVKSLRSVRDIQYQPSASKRGEIDGLVTLKRPRQGSIFTSPKTKARTSRDESRRLITNFDRDLRPKAPPFTPDIRIHHTYIDDIHSAIKSNPMIKIS